MSPQLPVPHHVLRAHVSSITPFHCWGSRGALHRGSGAGPTPYAQPARGRHRTQTRGSSEPGSQALKRKHWSPETRPAPGGARWRLRETGPHAPWSLPAPSTVVGLTGFHAQQPVPGPLSAPLPSRLKENIIPGRQREADTSESTSAASRLVPRCGHTCRVATATIQDPWPPVPDMEQAE